MLRQLTEGALTRYLAHLKLRPGPVINIALDEWLTPELIKPIEIRYLQRVAPLIGRTPKLSRLAGNDIWAQLRNQKIDIAVTSTLFYGGLPPEHFYFSSLPFGMSREEKIKWLSSISGESAQEEYFWPLGLHAQAIAVGSDQVGCLNAIQVSEPAQFKKGVIGITDMRAAWFSKCGMSVAPTSLNLSSPDEQVNALRNGQIQHSDIMSLSVALTLVKKHGLSSRQFSFTLFPGYKTAPTLHALWHRKSWDTFHGSHPKLFELGEATLSELSQVWLREDQKALRDLGRMLTIHTAPSELLEDLRRQARAFRQQLANQSGLAKRLEEAHGQSHLEEIPR